MQPIEIQLGKWEIKEYPLREPESQSPQTQISSTPQPPKIQQKNLTLEDYARLYHNENLVEVNGIKQPFVVINAFSDLQSQNMQVVPGHYQVPEQFRKFTAAALEAKKRPGAFDGQSIAIKDIKTLGPGTLIYGQQTGYFDFMSTVQSQDAYLRQFDDTFPEGETLRDHEIDDNGRSVPLTESNLSNLFGVGFMILNERQEYFILGMRSKNLAVEGGALGILGGTPEWQPEWKPNSRVDLGAYLKSHFDEEMKEELCLNPDEFKLKYGYWVKDFTRAPAILVTLTTDLKLEDIAARCENSESAKKEHTSLYQVPADRGLVYALAKGTDTKGYKIPSSSTVALDLAIG